MLKAMSNRISDMKDVLLTKYKSKLREKAINAAKSRIILAGNRVEDFDEDELETIVYEEEDKIIKNLKAGSLVALLVVLGIN